MLLALALPFTGCQKANAPQKAIKQDAPAKTPDNDFLAAVKQGDIEKVKTGLDVGADIEEKNPADGRTALMLAAVQGRAPLVALLIQRGAKIEAQDDDGITPLMWAAFGGSADAVRALKKAGASRKTKDKYGKTALDWGKDHPEVAAELGKK